MVSQGRALQPGQPLRSGRKPAGKRQKNRRRGAGRALLNAVRADARTRGCGRILLEYEKGNRAAEALYFSEGFRTVGERRGFYHGTDAVLADLEI